jgi:hypothetical protein
LTIPWIPPSPYQRREIIQGEGEPRSPIRPMRVRARAVFAESLRNAHRWLDELVMDPNQSIELISAREHKSERSTRMTLSLAFVAPPIVAAAIEGRLPRGFGTKRLMDLPIVWSHQWTVLGLNRLLPQLRFRESCSTGRAAFWRTASGGLGNGILSPETGGHFQALSARK